MKARKRKATVDRSDSDDYGIASLGRLDEDLEVRLPTERTEPIDDFRAYTWLLYGEKKIGKTTLCSQFGDCLQLFTEPGGKALRAWQRPLPDWKSFKGYIKLLANSDEFGMVAVDTAERLFKLCFKHVCKREGFEHPSDENDFGKSWDKITQEFESAIADLLSQGRGVFFVSHAKLHDVKRRNGEQYHQLGPNLSGQAMAVLEGIVDVIAYYGYEDSERIMVIRGDEHLRAGHRLDDHFNTTEGEQIITIPMGDSAKESLANLRLAWDNMLDDVGSVPHVAPKPVRKKKGRG